MRREDFGPTAPGRLVSIPRLTDEALPGGFSLLAFVPAFLPPDFPIPRDLLVAADAARGAISRLAGESARLPNTDLITRPLSRREAVLSSRIEGTQTEIREVLLKESLNAATEDDSDLAEVLNYLAALELGRAWQAEGRSLSASLIKDLHARLLQGVRGEDKDPGAFRRRNVYIGDRAQGVAQARFVPPPFEDVDALIGDLLSFVDGQGHYGPLVDCALIHYQFEAIHPFEDGNGRIGRLLLPLYLIQRAVIDRPDLYLSPYFDRHRREYVDRLLRVSTHDDWAGWVGFFLQAIRVQADDTRARVGRIFALQTEYRARIRDAGASRTALLAIDIIFARVFVSVPQIRDATRSSYPTARAAIESLTALGILDPFTRISGTQYWVANELARSIYEA